MNKEIKEILDFKENADYKKLSCDEIAILKDYITNLQNEIFELQEELLNKKLNVKDIEYKEKMVYKSRIEKAVEYIKEAKEQDFMWTPIFMKELLNILNGKE